MQNRSSTKKTLEEKKRDLKEKERVLREKEREYSQKKLIGLGKIAMRAGLSDIDPEVLFGAFLEVIERSKDPSVIAEWKIRSQKNSEGVSGNRIAVSFKNPPPIEEKNKLKDLNFRWNKFREEFYGFGDINQLSVLLKNVECDISIIS